MKFFRMISAVLAMLAGGNAFAAADIDEMLSDAVRKMRADLKEARISVSKVAVYAIEPDSGGKVNINMVFDQVETALLDSGRFAVINRKSLKALLEEQALSLTGVVDETQMVKAGKLVGAQGFFYGSVEVQKSKLILNIKLIEVESSAVVYSKKFTGESRNFARLGIGYFFSKGSGSTLDYFVFYKPMTGADVPLQPEPGQLDDVAVSSPVGFTLSYRQGFQSLSFAQLGVDLSYAHYAPAKAKIESADGAEEVLPAGGGTLTYNTIVETSGAHVIAITPKLYFETRDLFGWERDILNPYIGATVGLAFVDISFSGWAKINTYGSEYKQMTVNNDLILVMPVAGLEANLTQALSAYVEAAFLPSDATYSGGKVGMYMEPHLHNDMAAMVPKGLFLNLGVKYYFNLF